MKKVLRLMWFRCVVMGLSDMLVSVYLTEEVSVKTKPMCFLIVELSEFLNG